MKTRKLSWALVLFLAAATAPFARAQNAATNPPPAGIDRPLSLNGAINLALRQNGTILRGKDDLEAQYGLVVQTRAVAIPRLQVTGSYQITDETEKFPISVPGFSIPVQYQNWNTAIQLIQTVYAGGQIQSSLRSARLLKEQAVFQYQTVIADTLLQVRVTYYDVLQAVDQVTVEEASVKLLTQELEDQRRRFAAGTVPRFNVLRAGVELANERPRLIQARNSLRIAKNNLANLLGCDLPRRVREDVPLELTDQLDDRPYSIELPVAVAKALENRSELAALRKQESLRGENVATAKAGYKPTFQVFGGYGARNTAYSTDLGWVVNGPTVGAQVTWNIFDGFLTRGKIEQATALRAGARVDVDNEARSIELEVRSDYSNFIEARETLESQKEVVAEAEEALRLAAARNEAGTGTQLDVLSAQTSLTQARSTQVRALHDYDVARARLERAMGVNIMQTTGS